MVNVSEVDAERHRGRKTKAGTRSGAWLGARKFAYDLLVALLAAAIISSLGLDKGHKQYEWDQHAPDLYSPNLGKQEKRWA